MATEETPLSALAIDPGERVGWANGLIHPHHFQADQSGREHDLGAGLQVEGQGVHDLKTFALKMFESFANYDVVIYETWRLYPGHAKAMVGNDMQPSQLVGMIRLASWLNPKVKLVSQGATIKKTATKTMPAYIKDRFALSTEQHDQDALMHLWFYCWENYVS